MKSIKLGATLYVPAIRNDLIEVGNRIKFPNLRTVIFCTEDSVRDVDLSTALKNIKTTIPCLEPCGIFRYIRPRNLDVLRKILDMPYIDKINGFVLPKCDLHTTPKYFDVLSDYPNFDIMPILETKIVFNLPDLYMFRDFLCQSPLYSKIISLRIGALDLMSILNIRRDIDKNIYVSPIGYSIDQLITIFKPANFELSAPGFEGLDQNKTLIEELSVDISRGLFSKTAIHPFQVDIIHSAYKVSSNELNVATKLLEPQSPAVFREGNRMYEKSVHTNWALTIIERASIFGSYDISNDAPYDPLLHTTYVSNADSLE
jgi:citrate lyase beta subunit